MGLYIIIFVIGVIVGCILTISVCKLKNIGTLRVDTSDPYEDPYLFLELKRNVGNIQQKKYVLLKVNLENYVSQK